MSHCFRRSRFSLFACLPLIFGGMACLPTAALAQVQADQADIARSGAPYPSGAAATGEVDGHALSSPNVADLGEQAILKRSDSYQPFSASIACPFYYTSNAALTRTGEQTDFLEAPVVALSYQPRITSTLYALAMVREQLFYYDRFDALNFGSFDAEAGFVYLVPPWHDLILRAEFIYSRLTEKDSFDSFFSNYSIFASAEVPFRFGRAQQLSFGVDANISITADPEPPRRHEYETYIAYRMGLTRSLSLDLVGRLVVRQYQLTDRVDVSEVFAASANYTFNQYFTASAISTLAANQSNHSIFDYKVANVGGLLSLSVRF